MANAVVGTLRAFLTLDSAQFEAGLRRAQDGFKVFGKETQTLGRQATQLGATLTRTLTLPILGFGGAMAKAAIDFESSFAGVRKTVNASVPEFVKLAQGMRDLAKTIPVNVNELNRLGEAAGALGIPKDEILDFVAVMAQLGVTTNVTSDQAAESIAKIQNIFQSAGKETDRFASTLVALGNEGASTESQILELASRIASAGHAVGLSQGEVLGFAAAIANVGIEAEAGGSAISRVFIDIASAVSKGGQAVAGFASVSGMSIEKFSETFKTDAAVAMQAFIEGLGRVKQSGGDLIKTIEDLGFKEVRQGNLLRSLALSGDNVAKALRTQNNAWRENSALTEEARKRFETTQSQLTLLWNRIKDVGVTIGNSLLPMIKSMVGLINELLPAMTALAAIFGKLPVPIQAVAIGLGLALAAVGPLLYIFGQLAVAASQLALAFAAKGLATKALGLQLTLLGTTFKASTLLIAGFTFALAGIVVPLAMIAVYKLITNIQGLIADRAKWKADAIGQAAVHTRAMAEASRIAGREITDLAEAHRVLNLEASKLRVAKLGIDPAWTMSLKQSTIATAGTVSATAALTEQLRVAQLAMANLTPSVRANIAAGLELGKSVKEVAEELGIAESVVELYERALNKVNAQQKKTTDLINEMIGTEVLADARSYEAALTALGGASRLTGKEAEKFIETFDQVIAKYRLIGGVEGEKVVAHFAALKAQLSQTDAAAQIYLENELRGFEGSKISLAARDAAGNEYLQSELIRLNALDLSAHDYLDNEHRGWQASVAALEERDRAGNEFLQAELRRMAALEGTRFEDPFTKAMARGRKARQELVEMWKGVGQQLENATIGSLGTLLFGNIGHDVTGELKAAADEAELDFLRIQRSGRATAKELQVAFDRWRDAEDRANFSFAERFAQLWGGIKQSFVSVLDDMLQHFLRSFIGGLIKGMVSARLGQTLGNALMGSVAGVAAGGGAAVLAGGSGAAAAVAGVESAALGGTAAGGGATLAALATNPWTIGAAGAIALGLLVAKKGLFRGGEEAMHVNPRRDQFTAQFGGEHNLAARLTGLSGEHGGGHLFAALQRADSVKEFEAVQSAIAAFLGQFKQRVKLFNFGGFVPPGVTQPAILHGGAFGEDVTPRIRSQPSAGPSLSIHNTFNISSIDARGVREFVESRDFLDSFARVFEHNKGFIATRVRPSLVS